MRRMEVVDDGSLLARLAVMESKLDTVLSELDAIRDLVPAKIVEHTECVVCSGRPECLRSPSSGPLSAISSGGRQ